MKSLFSSIFMKTENESDRLINILIFLDMLFIGSDRIAIKVGGMTVRFVQLLLLVTFILIYKQKKFKLVDLLVFAPFLAANILSTFFSYDMKNSAAYIIWTVYNYLIVFCLFYSWAKDKSKSTVVDFWLLSFLVQSLYIFLQYIIGHLHINDPIFKMQVYKGIYRPAIWFYEPSYLATYFVIYFAMSLYLYINSKDNKYTVHMLVAYVCLLVTSSTTGYLAIVITLGAVILLTLIKVNVSKLRRLGFALVALMLLFSVTFVMDSDRFKVFIGRIIPSTTAKTSEGTPSLDVIKKMDASSGGRTAQWSKTFKIFKTSPILGIGPNAYGKFTKTNIPPTNVTLEIMVNLGLVGLITFVIFIFTIIIRALKNTSWKNQYNIAVILGLLIFGIVLQANQNYLRLYLWMALGILAGFTFNNKEEELEA